MFLLLACAESPPTGPELHRSALLQELDEGLGTCARIEEGSLRGECTLDLMVLHNRVEPGPCERLPEGTWRYECFFMAADNTDQAMETRLALCEQTGPFREDCLRHQAR